MFGMGGSEIIVILIVALIFLGPDKLPEAAKSISKGIRDIKKQSRVLQQSIEDDETIGGALRDIKSALRGEEPPPRPIRQPPVKKALPASAENSILGEKKADAEEAVAEAKPGDAAPAEGDAEAAAEAEAETDAPAKPLVRLPDVAGEADPDVKGDASDDAALAAMIKPAAGVVARGEAEADKPPSDDQVPERKHG